MNKRIKLNHHQDDYECMWNGIEDLYMNQTGETLPGNFFLLLSGFGSFCYLKTNNSPLKRMVSFGDGRTRKMYEFLSPIIGLEYKHYEYKTFPGLLKKAQSELDANHPVILGALDMYYLSYYPKLYHQDHIPFHYIMMTGCDDGQELQIPDSQSRPDQKT